MIIAGGLYREECIRPAWSRIFGSGGRAAAAVSKLSPGTRLLAYACEQWAEDAEHSMAAFGVTAAIHRIREDIAFHYLHPLSPAELSGAPDGRYSSLQVTGDTVLRFGFVEGDALVDAKRAIFDPQNPDETLGFRDNGSKAEILAIVLNEVELKLAMGDAGENGVRGLMQHSEASVVVVKRGPRGATVFAAGCIADVPAYAGDSVFKIGSGDVFSAVFAQRWGEANEDPVVAADTASRAVSRYVETRNTQVDLSQLTAAAPRKLPNPANKIYLAAPFFTLAQRWMVEEARRCLLTLGASVFSPIHDVGSQGDASYIAKRDLEGLEQCAVVLALVDGEDAGTLFEVGHARRHGIPVVALAESPRPESLTMLQGTGCSIVSDFSTALYQAVWETAR
ncbi:nucleoside 2-deoxyribosyltransferase [Bosea sp. OK403]|uniref:nucleoside 2-deoxyribosyltransferase n=1 Tax=Bosea sp. OK403 TaxID=1855286 RepID=UPI000B80D94D|nr:nucleoside 2-deoxyribosyltransferase [Bosea sp. OK403]